jgi:acyl carrier protein
MSDNVAERVTQVVARSRNLSEAEISMDTSFEELGMSSLDALALIFDLEEEFGVSIPDNEAMQVTSVRQTTAALEKLLAERGNES